MKTRSLFALCLWISLAFAYGEKTPPPPAPIDGLVLKPDLWSQGVAEVEAVGGPLGFEWTSAAKDSARSVRPSLTLGGQSLSEVLVRLGLVTEKEIPQAFGGHMRLITGYNTTTGEILYSDSWGMGHEEKRMPASDAWAITMGMNSLQPLGS